MRRIANNNTNPVFLVLIAGVIALSTLLFSASYAEQNEGRPNSSSNSNAGHSPNVIDAVDRIELFCVSDGEINTRSFARNDLEQREELQVDGYVCGITLFCEGGMDITANGKQLRNLQGCSSSCYSFFPPVPGDALSQEPEIDLVFRNAVGVRGLTIRQQPSRTVTRNSADWIFATDRIEFLGSTQDRMRAQATDFEKRVNAVEYGVEFVESAVGSKLVKDIKIVDCSSPRGAVSCDQSADIWVYANTFLDESVDELSVISSHEALHVLVERLRLARDSEVRELFARLWGYDEFSRERFAIVTAGIAPPADPRKVPQDGIFFAFISEHNFLDSMKGGHAQTGTEEFCVSFLHSLLYLDRLQQNLEQPLRLGDEAEREPRALSTDEKEKIISDYLSGIETLLQALPESDNASLSLKSFLQERRGRITDRFVGKTMPPA